MLYILYIYIYIYKRGTIRELGVSLGKRGKVTVASMNRVAGGGSGSDVSNEEPTEVAVDEKVHHLQNKCVKEPLDCVQLKEVSPRHRIAVVYPTSAVYPIGLFDPE